MSLTLKDSGPRLVTVKVYDENAKLVDQIELPPVKVEVTMDLLSHARWEVGRLINKYPEYTIAIEIEKFHGRRKS